MYTRRETVRERKRERKGIVSTNEAERKEKQLTLKLKLKYFILTDVSLFVSGGWVALDVRSVASMCLHLEANPSHD